MDMEEDCWKHRNEAQVARHLQSTCPARQMLLPRELNHSAFLLSWRLQGPDPPHPAPSPAQHCSRCPSSVTVCHWGGEMAGELGDLEGKTSGGEATG